MGIASKGMLLFNTIKYLKPQQTINQVLVRYRKKELFWKYKKENITYNSFDLWVNGIDNDSVFIQRYNPVELMSGRIRLLNESREFNQWFFGDASHLWNFNVHYLEYLVPLFSLWRTEGSKRYRDKINEVLESWYEEGSNLLDSNQPYTISLRIVNQLIIADSVNDKKRLFESVYAQYRYLLKHQEKHLLGNHYLENLKAIVICSVVFSEDRVYEKYIKKLLIELGEEITLDGLHFELSLMYHKIVMEDLIRVALILNQAHKREYDIICAYIKKMASSLYSIECGISRTPLFNDSGDNVSKPTKALLDVCREIYDVKPEKLDVISGYYKLYDGDISVIVDCGGLSPTYMPGHAHCDCLSFELFYKGNPIFVNCGTYQYQGEKRKYFRSTGAHNTVMINNHEQSELWGEHRAARRIRNVRGKKKENTVYGSYYNYYGEKHFRQIQLKGGVLDVLDVTSGEAKSFLHLAPGLKYKDGAITGLGLRIEIVPIKADVVSFLDYYADSFGKIEEIECLLFTWKKSKEKHGYRIYITEGETK